MLIPGTSEYIIFHVKRERAEVIEDIEMGRLSRIILVNPKRGRQRSWIQIRRCDNRPGVGRFPRLRDIGSR